MGVGLRGRAVAERPLTSPTLHVCPKLLPDNVCDNNIVTVVHECSSVNFWLEPQHFTSVTQLPCFGAQLRATAGYVRIFP